MEKKIDKTEQDLQNIRTKNENLQAIRKNKIEGIMIRSKARWAAEGEKVSKYFCSLESRHFTSKQMFKLINDKGDEIHESKKIAEETK